MFGKNKKRDTAKKSRARQESEAETSETFHGLHKETARGVCAVLFFAVAGLLCLSAFNRAGIAGSYLYAFLSFLLGIGYFLLPLLFLFWGVSLLRPEGRRYGLVKTIGALLFFFAGLGTIDLAVAQKGGLVGTAISSSLVSLFDYQASFLFLIAFLIIAFLVLFNARFLPNAVFSAVTSAGSILSGLARPRRSFAEDGEEADEELYEDTSFDMDMEEEPVVGEPSQTAIAAEKTPTPAIVQKNTPEAKTEWTEKDGLMLRSYEAGSVYTPPPTALLETDRGKPGVGDIKANANIIKRTLQNFGITVEMDEISIGPSVTRYALKPAEGVKLSRIVGLKNDLSLALAAHPLRIEAPIPGKSLVGIEIPNTHKSTVGLGGLVASDEFQKSGASLLVTLGKGVSGKSHFANVEKMPHLLIAGATGSGKSVTIHTIITSLLYRNAPENLRFIMIDPKRVELTLYNNIPHLLTPVITNAKQTILALKWAAKEMDRRYDVLEAEAVRDISSYHKNILAPALKKASKVGKENTEERAAELPERMPYIVIIIDELADIMQAYPRELESAIVRLAQMSRAVGIHLVLSTQRPSVNIITGLIKANIPTRIALQVASQIDSRTILDTGGAETLLGAGDMLYLSGEMSKPQRIQSAFISEGEVKRVVGFLTRQHRGALPSEITLPEGNGKNHLFAGPIALEQENEDEDDLYEEAREIVSHAGKASTSYLQRKLRIGYARAARLMDILEERGVIGPSDGSKPRSVIDGSYTESDRGEDFELSNAREETAL